jgi:hypothetical protein
MREMEHLVKQWADFDKTQGTEARQEEKERGSKELRGDGI